MHLEGIGIMAVKLSIEMVIALVANDVIGAFEELHSTEPGSEQEQHFRAMTEAIRRGHADGLVRLLGDTAVPGPREGVPTATLRSANEALLRFTRLVPALYKEEVSVGDLQQVVDCLFDLGINVDMLGERAVAYNLVAYAQGVAGSVGIRHLSIAEKLIGLADEDQPDQVHAARWVYAAERLKWSIEHDKDWLRTLDAVETALAVRVSDTEHQKNLADGLLAAFRDSAATDSDELLALCVVQSPAECVGEPQWARVNKKLADVLGTIDPPPRIDGPGEIPDHVLATIVAQMMAEDLRMRLGNREAERPSLTWLDMKLTHSKLAAAVPLGQGLMSDVNRTGEFVLELIHEITHAYCLNGPIGSAVQANRAAVRLFEVLIAAYSAVPPRAPDPLRFEVLKQIQNDDVVGALAEAQLSARLRSAKLEAIWLPWLEGVAQYVEMLADPRDNPHEILPVHESVRGLIDFKAQDLVDRAASDRWAERFDDFVGKALSRLSKLRQTGYLSNTPTGRVYLLGLLLVRSVVARWEATLGRRIKPIYAAKLLIEATRRGCLAAVQRQLDTVDPSLCDLARPMVDWFHSIARMDASTLEVFLQDVGRNERSHRYVWLEGGPHRVESGEDELRRKTLGERADKFFEDLCRRYVSLENVGSLPRASVPPDVASEWEPILDSAVDVFRYYVGSNRFLPVGRDAPRLIFFEREGACVLVIRTLARLGAERNPNLSHRYSVIAVSLSEKEVEYLHRLCGRNGTSRVLATRVIDLLGDHKCSQGLSYFCLFFGNGDWERVGLGAQLLQCEWMDDEFVAMLRRRVLESPLVHGGEQDLGSLGFLASRLEGSKRVEGASRAARDFDPLKWSEDAGRRAAAEAFMTSADRIDDWLESSLNDQARRVDLANLLHYTGMGNHAEMKGDQISQFEPVFSTVSYSGVTGFGTEPN